MAEDKLTPRQRLRPYLERWAPLLTAFWAGMITLALLIAFLPWFRNTPHVSGPWLAPWTWPHMDAMAAWVQAIGSIAAIYFAGRSAERLFERQRLHELELDDHSQRRERETNRLRVMETASTLSMTLLGILMRRRLGAKSAAQKSLTMDLAEKRLLIPDGAIAVVKAAKAHVEAFGAPLADEIVYLESEIDVWNDIARDLVDDQISLASALEELNALTTLTEHRLEYVRGLLEPFLPKSLTKGVRAAKLTSMWDRSIG